MCFLDLNYYDINSFKELAIYCGIRSYNTQREALEAMINLVEIKLKQLNAKVNIYRALGGGWN